MQQDILDSLTLPDDMSDEKREFLTEAIEGSRSLKKNELLPYLTRLIKTSKEKNLQFTDDEIKIVIMAIRAGSSPEQNQYIDKIINGVKQRSSGEN